MNVANIDDFIITYDENKLPNKIFLSIQSNIGMKISNLPRKFLIL